MDVIKIQTYYNELMKALVVGSSDIDIFVSPESEGSFIEDEETVAFRLGDKIPIDVKAFAVYS